MMHQEHEFNYSENELCQVLRLPYGNNAYSLTLLLPKEGKTINDVLQTLTAETWQQYQWMSGKAIVDVKLPRFESQSSIDLKGIMTALGMPNAFNDNLAEFPNFCNVPTAEFKSLTRLHLPRHSRYLRSSDHHHKKKKANVM